MRQTPRGWANRRVLLTVVGVIAGLAATPALAAAPTKARAQAFARAVNLTAADLPGFKGSPSSKSRAEQQFGAMLSRCAGGVDPSREVVDVDSPDFSMEAAQGLEEQDVNSNVSVLRSAALAAKDLKAVKSARGRSCLTKATNKLLTSMKTKGVTYGKTTLTKLKRSAPGSDGSFAFHFKVTANANGLRLPFYIDTIGFTLGPAEIGLTTLGIAEPFPATVEQRLLTLLAGRASFNHL